MTISYSYVHQFLENSAAKFPDKIAVIHEKLRVEYSQVNKLSNQLANFIINQGIERGSRVALLCENCVEYVVSYFGILKAGCTVVSLNPVRRSR